MVQARDDVSQRRGRHEAGWQAVDMPGDHGRVLEGKTPVPTRQQAINVQAAILAALQKRDGEMVIGSGTPTKWTLKSA